ncbi:MAG: hypothetical protein PHU12_03475 [Candidatus Aenigmarchaeota archaeon]|nr:hypothetical protein [Candidatus Aenigmarchaeota archaeon]
MVNLGSDKLISRREVSKKETREYREFLRVYDFNEDEVRRVGNVEQQLRGQLLLEKGHVTQRYIPDPILGMNADWTLEFDSLSEEHDDQYKGTVTLAIDIERSTQKKKIYVFENTVDDTDDKRFNIDMKGRAGKSKHSIAYELWVQEQLPILLQQIPACDEVARLCEIAGVEEMLLQKRYNIFLDDFRAYYNEILKNDKSLKAVQRKSKAINWLIMRSRLFEVKEVAGELVTLFSNI